MKSDKLHFKSKAQKRLSVSPAHLDRLISSGELPVVKVGKRAVRIAESALESFIQRRTELRGGS
jgi:excisionase family DNA binding protein